MNQPTHAWLAVEAYRIVLLASKKDKQLTGLADILESHLHEAVVGAWVPDSIIKDMTYGHVFKNSSYKGDQKKRFTMDMAELKKMLPAYAQIPTVALKNIKPAWWKGAYRVKDNGGHLPARVTALCFAARDMMKLGDKGVVKAAGKAPSKKTSEVAAELLYSTRDIALFMWILSHYVADAHMPFHSDNRALASTAKCKTHSAVEKEWGKNVPQLFKAGDVLKKKSSAILKAPYPKNSKFEAIDFGGGVAKIKTGGDPWKQAVYICRAGFATSFAWVSAEAAPVDSPKKISFDDILAGKNGCCGEEVFWKISRAIMHDAANAIAMIWGDIWMDFLSKGKK